MQRRRKLIQSYNGWTLNKQDKTSEMLVATNEESQKMLEDDVTVAMATQPHRKE